MGEALLEVRNPLIEDNVNLMRKASKGAMQTMKMKDGKVKMDSFTASAIMSIYDNVNSKNKNKIEDNSEKLETKLFDEVYALGNPQGNAATFSRGKITGETYNLISGFDAFYEEDALVFQHDAPIEGGNSGGGLFDNNGNLIAINSAGSIESMENKNLIPHSYAIAIDEFLEFLP